MMRFSFRKGLSFFRGERRFTIIRRLMDSSLQLEGDDGEVINCLESEILLGCTQGVWHVDTTELNPNIPIDPRVSRDLRTFSVKAQVKARVRQQYLDRLSESGKLVCNLSVLAESIKVIAAEINDVDPPSAITLYRWNRRQKKAGNSLSALADRFENRGRRLTWTKEVKEVVDRVIETLSLRQMPYPKISVVENVEINLLNLQKQNPEKISGLQIPSQASIYRYIDKLEAYDLTVSRFGKPEAERRYRRVLGTQKTNRVLERWEIDHTPLDLLIVCEKTLLPLGRPWLTMAIDKFSRMPVGFYLSFRAPSAYAVLQCIKQAIQPKDDLLTPYSDITLPWPARGIPEVIVCDNGMDLHANAFISVCQELGIQVQFCPAKKPEYKGSVERFFRTINHDLIHKIPGTVFSSPKARGDYQSEKKACITLDVLLHLITKWVAEIYSHTPHRGIGMTPYQKWEMGVAQRVIEHPVEPSQLDVIVGDSDNRRVFHYGIEINGLHYNNHELQFLRRRYGEDLRVDLKYYEDDMGYVHVFDPGEKNYFKVEAIDQEYASDLRLVQHKAIRKVILDLKKDPNNRQVLLQKKKELQEIVSQAMFSHKMARRKLSAVYKGKDNLVLLDKDLFIDDQNLIDDTNKLSDDLPTYDINIRADLDEKVGGYK